MMKDLIVRLILRSVPDTKAIYLFGSWGSPAQREDSDIDLAILPAAPLDNVACWNLTQELAGSLKRDVDLIDLLSASTVMRSQVIENGERIYCGDRPGAEAFESLVFSDYVRLNEERADILRAVRERGSVHAG